MIGLLFIWDEGWFHPWTELTLWHDLSVAYGVDLLIMIPDLRIYSFNDIKLEKYGSVEEALVVHKDLQFVFLEPKSIADEKGVSSESLTSFTHPLDALYIFGNSGRSNIGLVDPLRGDKVVYIKTPIDSQIWSIQVASMVLRDRASKI